MIQRWSKRKIVLCVSVLLIVYLVFVRLKKYNVKCSATISNCHPIELWEFVSDFSNMKKLNPTITNFVIESESGNYDHWKYKVYYTEFLSNIPFISNFAWADFEAKTLGNNKYSVYSNHKTCFFTSLMCVNTESTFTVEPTATESESHYTESITYECPAFLWRFCKSEVLYQREKIHRNLQNVFNNRHNFNT